MEIPDEEALEALFDRIIDSDERDIDAETQLEDAWCDMLAEVPDADLGREWMRRLTLRRVQSGKPQKGRNKVLRPCPWCLAQFGALELRKHKPGCAMKIKEKR